MTATARIRQKLIAVDAKMIGSTPAIVAIAASGARYQLRHRPTDMAAAERLADKIAARGSLDEAHWDLVGVTAGSRAAAHLGAKVIADAARYEAGREARWAA